MLVQIANPSIAALICETSLTESDQIAIEAEITRISNERDCTRQRAAQLMNREAHPINR